MSIPQIILNMNLRKPTLLFSMVTFLVLVIDQLTKSLIIRSMSLFSSFPEEGILRLTYVVNSGSAFGLFQGMNSILIIVSLIGVVGIIWSYYIYALNNSFLQVALALLLGGAFGNLADRIFRGAVVDFIDVRLYESIHFPAFNIADSSLSAGLFLLSCHWFLEVGRNAESTRTGDDVD
jgi:signal peptidase II